MKWLFSFLFFVTAWTVAASHLAVAGGVDATPNPEPVNAFAGPLMIHGELKPSPKNEDLANPYVEAHQIEEYLYLNRYFWHYHAKPQNTDAPPQEEPTASVDSEGHPLWLDRPYGFLTLQSLVTSLFWNKQFDDLDRLFADWNNPAERTADGQWKLVAFSEAMDVLFWQPNDRDAVHEIVRDWRARNPRSAAAAIAEARYWSDYGWSARGDGPASSVAPEGWRLLSERLENAQKVLTDSKPYASESPLWGRVQIEVGLGLNWSKAELLRVFQESAARQPYFYSLYTEMVNALLPKWGGSWELVDDFIRAAVKNTEAVEGYSLYSRLYWAVDPCNCNGPGLFTNSLANWPDMKRGFEDLIHRYPHSAWLANRYAAYACMAGDKDTFVRLRLTIGKIIVPAAWPQSPSLDVCDHRFPAQPL